MAGASETELLAALRRLPHFAELTPELLSLVAARARRRTASRGDVLCRAGEPGEEFFLVIGGAVRIAVPSARGEEVVAELGTGEWFGEMALITGEPRSASAIAGTDAKLAVLARTDFLELVAQVPALGLAVSHVLSRRLRARLRSGRVRLQPAEHPKRAASWVDGLHEPSGDPHIGLRGRELNARGGDADDRVRACRQ